MFKIPEKAPHLKSWPLAIWMERALGEYGQAEIPGAKSNPRIIEYRKISGLNLAGDDGAVPWCAIFVNAMLRLANVPGSGSAMARSFASSRHFKKLAAPVVGCITVISSSRGPSSGHVFFYTAENDIMLQGLGANQNDAVNVAMFPKSKLVGYYWPASVPLPNVPFNQPVKLPRPLLPHERRTVKDA